jgi:DNA-binding NtrC family response regulator
LEIHPPKRPRRYRWRDRRISRCKAVRIQTAPLREIAGDIPIIAKHFLKKHCDILNIETKQFAPAAVRRLQLYPWPGNARQLENEVKRLVASVRGLTIGADHLDLPREPAEADSRKKALSFDGKTIDEVVEDIERRMVDDSLNNITGTNKRRPKN